MLDVNLGDQPAFPIANVLNEQHIPFASGYGDDEVATRYPGVRNCGKPLDMLAVLRSLEAVLQPI